MNFVLPSAANSEALLTAEAVAQLVNDGTLSDPLPADPAVRVQVVDPRHRVLAVSPGADRLVPILHPDELDALGDREGQFIAGSRIGLNGRVRVVVVDAGTRTNPERV